MRRLTVALLICTHAWADSIERKDGSTVFGFVNKLDGANLTLIARHPTKDQKNVSSSEVVFLRKDVESIDFNDSDFNPGGPPSVGANPPKPNQSWASNLPDRIELNGGENRTCAEGAAIDNKQIRCGKDKFPLPEKGEGAVLRIHLRTK